MDPTRDKEDAGHRSIDGRCVVLSPPGASKLGALMRALSGRWRALSVVADEPAVMEELVAGGVSMVVVVEPDRWPGLKPLAMAIGEHFGDVMCMQFDTAPGERTPRISALATRWIDDPNARALALLEQEAHPPQENQHTQHTDNNGSEPTGPLNTEAAQPQPYGTDPSQGEPDPLDGGGIIVGPTGHTNSRRRKVQNLVVPAPPTKHNGAALPEPIVSQEELSMLLGPPPAETA